MHRTFFHVMLYNYNACKNVLSLENVSHYCIYDAFWPFTFSFVFHLETVCLTPQMYDQEDTTNIIKISHTWCHSLALGSRQGPRWTSPPSSSRSGGWRLRCSQRRLGRSGWWAPLWGKQETCRRSLPAYASCLRVSFGDGWSLTDTEPLTAWLSLLYTAAFLQSKLPSSATPATDVSNLNRS